MKVCAKCNKDKPLKDYPALTRMAGGKSKVPTITRCVRRVLQNITKQTDVLWHIREHSNA